MRVVAVALLSLLSIQATSATIAVEDSIRMARIQQAPGDGNVAISRDGRRVVCVVWQGDVESDRNLYSLLFFDLRQQPSAPRVLLTDAYRADARDQHATPISSLRFLSDRVVAFLGALGDQPAQVYTIDVETRELRQLTDHPAAVRSFDASADAQMLAFSALAARDESQRRELGQHGFSLWDSRLFTPFSPGYGYGELSRPTPEYPGSVSMLAAFARVAYGEWSYPVRHYFLSTGLSTGASRSRKLLQASAGFMAGEIDEGHLRQMPDLTVSPTGTHAIVVPFTRVPREAWQRYRYFRERGNPYVQAMVTSFGLLDLETGRAEPLIDTPVDFYRTPRPLWARDGQSVVIRSVLPAAMRSFETEPHLIEVDIASRAVRSLPGSEGWEAVQWNEEPESLVLRRGSSVGISLRQEGAWQPVSVRATRADTGFNPRYDIVTDGNVIVGVKDDLTTAPELALYDIASRRGRVLTDLNPELRRRRYAPVEKVFWEGPAKDEAFGYLIKPVGFVEGKRYPALVLLKDEGSSDTTDDSFLIDGQHQLSGWAIQAFAAKGLLVLLTPAPPSLREVALTPGEGPRIMAHVERAIGHLESRQLIDPRRVGISGWSRAAYWTDYILTHSKFDFAAATDIDGGGNYRDFHQRWGASVGERDGAGRFHLDVRNVRTPLLSQQHGASSLIGQGEFIAALSALGKPVELFYHPDAPHSVKTPLHRLHSLQRHIDWFRFWLQDYEDPDPEKLAQYARWRKMKPLLSSRLNVVPVERS